MSRRASDMAVSRNALAIVRKAIAASGQFREEVALLDAVISTMEPKPPSKAVLRNRKWKAEQERRKAASAQLKTDPGDGLETIRDVSDDVTGDVSNDVSETPKETQIETPRHRSVSPAPPLALSPSDFNPKKPLSEESSRTAPARARGVTGDVTGDALETLELVSETLPKKLREQRRWRRLPKDFEPTVEHRRLARELGVDLDAQMVLLRDHEFDKPKSDPAAVLRTWLRRAAEFKGVRSNGGSVEPARHKGLAYQDLKEG